MPRCATTKAQLRVIYQDDRCRELRQRQRNFCIKLLAITHPIVSTNGVSSNGSGNGFITVAGYPAILQGIQQYCSHPPGIQTLRQPSQMAEVTPGAQATQVEHPEAPSSDGSLSNGRSSEDPPGHGPFCCYLDEDDSEDNWRAFQLRNQLRSSLILARFLCHLAGERIGLFAVQRDPIHMEHLILVRKSQNHSSTFCDFAMRCIGLERWNRSNDWVYERVPFDIGAHHLGQKLNICLNKVVKCERHGSCYEISVFL